MVGESKQATKKLYDTDYNLWVLETVKQLQNYLREIYSQCYQKGRKLASTASKLPLAMFPEQPIAELEEILNEDLLPERSNFRT